ncbi:conjugal transfer protein TraD [Legionella bozemanae]|uniref:Protein TraD n=1 Tax=Legionella bozemanae TaxID=447 RepID=A0A0W0RXF8_LEGBO|nr:conjugal transfer protein TraD [Legionella bozemanae]KTC75895.1 protein TraD [Legionella bozemanae]STO35480.1 conjugal transfer protein TraD [Legionella bozemanae]
MSIHDQIKRQQQVIVRYEKSIVLERLKKRKADTRRKIELGGLVIKSGMDGFNKSVILGALDYSLSLLREDEDYTNLFETKGNNLFLNK